MPAVPSRFGYLRGQACPAGSDAPTPCDGTSYTTAGLQASCVKCASGSHLTKSNGVGTCTLCAAGTSSSSSDVACEPCGEGLYSAAGATKCVSASAGFYVNAAKTAEVACEDASVYCQNGQKSSVVAGFYSTPASGDGTQRTGQTKCEAGYYCSGGIKTGCAVDEVSVVGITHP